MSTATAPAVSDVHTSEQGITWARVQGSIWVRGQGAYELLVRATEVSRSLAVTR
jgi:hypothetical protein